MLILTERETEGGREGDDDIQTVLLQLITSVLPLPVTPEQTRRDGLKYMTGLYHSNQILRCRADTAMFYCDALLTIDGRTRAVSTVHGLITSPRVPECAGCKKLRSAALHLLMNL